MTFFFNGAQANVSITGGITTIPTVNILGTGQTSVVRTLASNGSNQNIYTVTAGKTFYLFGAGMMEPGAYDMYVYANDGTTIIAFLRGTTNTTSILSSAVPIAVYTATQNVVVKCTSSHQQMIWGIEA